MYHNYLRSCGCEAHRFREAADERDQEMNRSKYSLLNTEIKWIPPDKRTLEELKDYGKMDDVIDFDGIMDINECERHEWLLHGSVQKWCNIAEIKAYCKFCSVQSTTTRGDLINVLMMAEMAKKD